ncbi:hypothetical protein D3C76_1575940 [compost metagenome]
MIFPALPYRADGMNHRFSREISRNGNHRMARRQLALMLTDNFTGFQQLRSGRAMNGSVNASSPHQ